MLPEQLGAVSEPSRETELPVGFEYLEVKNGRGRVGGQYHMMVVASLVDLERLGVN